jgi:hypothetical protein
LTFPDPGAEPNGTVAMNPETFYALRTFVPGSFTRPGATQIAATLDGCEPHSSNYGGTLVAEKRGGSWARIRYDSGVHPDSCLPYRRGDGRDVLVCRWGDGHQSYWHDRIFSYDFTLGTEDEVAKNFEEIVSMDDDSIPGCMGVPRGDDVRAGQVDRFDLRDEDGDSAPELVVEVSQIRGKPNKAYQALCKKMSEALDTNGPEVDVKTALGKRQKFRLVYAYDGTKFVPSKATEKILRRL